HAHSVAVSIRTWPPSNSRFSVIIRPPSRSTLFPYTTLFRSQLRLLRASAFDLALDFQGLLKSAMVARLSGARRVYGFARDSQSQDRKSTRLNSSHLGISYAVFCLKKKTKTFKIELERMSTFG